MEKFQDILNNTPEKTMIFNQENGKSVLIVRTKGVIMVEDIHKAFKEMQEIMGIEEKEDENK